MVVVFFVGLWITLGLWWTASGQVPVKTTADRLNTIGRLTGLVGTYLLRANQHGGGAHVCNCGYVTAPDVQGKGVAHAMCLHSLEHARVRGFRAMQFNFVVSTNTRAVALWERCGFEVVGRLPKAFAHPTLGEVDALVMHRTLI